MSEKWPPYTAFECAPGLKLAAHERVSQIHYENLNKRLDQLEEMMERLERRLWLAVYGVVAAIAVEAVQQFLVAAP